MFGSTITPNTPDRLSDELRTDWKHLDLGCRQYGVTAWMFRAVKFVYYIVTLGFAAYLIEAAGVEPVLAMSFAALLITGPEGVEAYLVRQGVIADRHRPTGDDD